MLFDFCNSLSKNKIRTGSVSRALVTAALLHGQKAFDALANGGQAEACGVDFGKGYPLGVGGIVAGGNALQTGYATQEKASDV